MTEPHDAATAPNPETRWEIALPENPFQAALVITDGDHTLLDWLLDPATLTDLLAALTTVRDRQVHVLTGHPTPTDVPPADPEGQQGGPVERDGEPERQRPKSWWARHKALTVLLTILTVMFLLGLITGGTDI